MGRRLEALPPPIHNDISFVLFVVPGLTPYPVRGRLRNPASFWIPALHHTIVNGKRKLALYARHFLEKSPQPPFYERGARGDFVGEF